MEQRLTWRHYVNEIHQYHWFKSFKVYWAYRLMQREQVESEVSEIKIDRILLDNGWQRENKEFNHYSSMGDICNIYRKEGKTVTTGLNVAGYPPTLITPLPQEVINKMREYNNKEVEKETCNFPPEDPFTIEWILEKSEDDIKEWLNSL